MLPRKSILIASVCLIAAAGLLAAVAYLKFSGAPNTAVTRSSGTALIGGPFELTSHTGKRVKDSDFRGRYMLVFFGYTFCPDICPAELQVMSAALDKLGAKASRVQPIFITVDPERDTVEALKAYVEHFHKSLIGLTGTAQEIKQAARRYRVYYAKAKDNPGATDYLVDHSSLVYLMGPDGRYITHFPYGTKPEAMARGISDKLS